MRIMHLCLGCFYVDGYSYQENMLPKYHLRQGHEVEIVASLESFDSTGEASVLDTCPEPYTNEYGIQVTRLDYRFGGALRKFRKYVGLKEALVKFEPELLFIHGCQFGDMKIVVDYLKQHPKVKVYVDNHADYSNSATGWLSKNVLHRIYWRRQVKLIEPFTEVFWGVLPARVDFLVENYHLPRPKCQLLVMGADDEEVEKALMPGKMSKVRSELGVADDEILLVTGGKIDLAKTQIIALMEAVIKDPDSRVKLLVFGPVVDQLRDRVLSLAEHNRIIYRGWATSSQSYGYFAAADLVVFPGRHSVYWEQVAALGTPLLVKRWAGTDHIDMGGNLRFTQGDSESELRESYRQIIDDEEVLSSMKSRAAEVAENFLYSSIAQKSIGEEHKENRIDDVVRN